MKIAIKHVHKRTAAFTINGELYYVKTGPDFPVVYNKKLEKLIIPNIDLWLQAQTQQRYSFRGLQDMMEAYVSGTESNYTNEEISSICNDLFDSTIRAIFNSKNSLVYSKIYKIELMNLHEIKKLISLISANFEDYVAKFSRGKLHNYLCRILAYCNLHNQDDYSVVEKLIARLGNPISTYVHESSPEEDAIKSSIMSDVFKRFANSRKDMNSKLAENTTRIEKNEL